MLDRHLASKVRHNWEKLVQDRDIIYRFKREVAGKALCFNLYITLLEISRSSKPEVYLAYRLRAGRAQFRRYINGHTDNRGDESP